MLAALRLLAPIAAADNIITANLPAAFYSAVSTTTFSFSFAYTGDTNTYSWSVYPFRKGVQNKQGSYNIGTYLGWNVSIGRYDSMVFTGGDSCPPSRSSYVWFVCGASFSMATSPNLNQVAIGAAPCTYFLTVTTPLACSIDFTAVATVSASASTSTFPTLSTSASARSSSLASLSATASSSAFPTPTTSTYPCPAGFFPAQFGCMPCSPGTYSLANSAVCSLCPAGTYGNRAGLTTPSCSGACASCAAGSIAPAYSSTCGTADSRAVPSAFGLQIWPAAHPANPQRVDLVIAPASSCAQLSPGGVCTTLAENQITGADGITRFVVGTAADFHMQADEKLSCTTI